ncbi:acyltransferas-like protein [Cucurbitaria berberidis CBS 394.84]|uniref:Acyltransferas-like protein n=1 Tax=Cucurbitaria berberidis CBS 394.84 TaxID=1168544 RepID=A0A9P4L305_9PLEO|nr:acyltransferas-like protein [Cucurbitaria berberidis CBS 394.84]KAF1840351.1 acyltransferas-like protein [Cucurbitaria berberidis CBS 394.84]
MPTKFNGLLDHGGLEDVNLHTTTWKPVRTARWSIDAVRPEFLSLRPGSPKKQSTRPTAWLDGLRGFAALMVYIHHNQLWSHGGKGNLIYENGFGYEGRHYFAALPFVRLFFSGGHFAVAIFFVISGYVLSVKTLSLIQRGQTQHAADGIGSALFRRWLRLYIPIIAVTFLWMCLRHWTKIWVDMRDMNGTFREDVRTWYQTFKNYSFVFSTNIYEFTEPYHPHTWSIPIEFKGSIIVYTALSAFAKCSQNARLWCEVGLIFYFLYIVDGYFGALFMSGMLLCDLDLLAQDEKLPRFLARLAGFKELIFFHLFIIALYLGGVPSYDPPGIDRVAILAKSPGWIWLSRLKPQAVFDAKWFYLFWAAFLAVASVPRLPWLRYFFETRFCQYLARISFALYLVHGLMIWTLGDRIYAAAGLERPSHKDGIPGWANKFPLSKRGPMGLELAFWVPQIVILPATLYMAEVVTKLIDEPSVKFANWVYRKALSQTQAPKQ